VALLDDKEREAALEHLPGWGYDEERRGLTKSFRFADFAAAFAFMGRVAVEAERRDHHPDWFNAWNRVEILLTTHRAKGVTGKDIELAAAIDRAA